MTEDDLALVDRLGVLLKARDAAARALLDAGVTYRTLGLALAGQEQVFAHLTGEGTGRFYRDADWSAARLRGGAAMVEVRPPEQSADDNKILLFTLRDHRVAMIEEQLLLPIKRPPETRVAMSASLKAMVNGALATCKPMLVAHVDEGGQPAISFRGSIHVVGDDQLALWVRNPNGGFIRAIALNPQVALMYRDNETRATFQFQGRARVAGSEADRKRVFESIPAVERDHDFGELGTAVIIDLDRIEGYAKVEDGRVVGAVNMRRA